MTTRALLVCIAGLAALASGAAWAQGATPCGACGVITSIVPVTERQEWTPLGVASPGAVGMSGLGGATGTTAALSIGPGGTNQGMVLLGAAGGAVYAQRPSEYRRQRWDVTIKMENGPPRVVAMRYEPLLVQEGDRVRVAGNNIELVTP
jgi:outer membrane lipoprotein SlyB